MNINDPRNPNSPFNMRNPNSPFNVWNPRSPFYDSSSDPIPAGWYVFGLFGLTGILVFGFLSMFFPALLGLLFFVFVGGLLAKWIHSFKNPDQVGWIIVGCCISFPLVMTLICVLMGW